MTVGLRRDHLAQAKPDAGECAGPAHHGPRIHLPVHQAGAVFLRCGGGAGTSKARITRTPRRNGMIADKMAGITANVFGAKNLGPTFCLDYGNAGI